MRKENIRIKYKSKKWWTGKQQRATTRIRGYFIIKKEASKTKIKEAITAGKDVQGARLIENRNLQIK